MEDEDFDHEMVPRYGGTTGAGGQFDFPEDESLDVPSQDEEFDDLPYDEEWNQYEEGHQVDWDEPDDDE